MKLIRFVLILLGYVSVLNAAEKDFNYIFQQGMEGYNCFRIPAIVKTTNGTLLAFAEARKKSCSDTGDIDMVLRKSRDGGKTWSKMVVIWDDGDNVCGNPAPVVEKESGKVYLLMTWNLGSDHERDIIAQKSEDTRRVFITHSADDGKSWSKPSEITTTTKKENWTWYATGPVHGIQLTQNKKYKGRLIIPCDHIEAETKHYYSHVIFSDDHGETWQLGGSTPQHQVNECAIAELSNGDLMLNMRNYDRESKNRKISISKDGGLTWGDIKDDPVLVEPICQGSLLNHENLLFFSNPASKESRENMTLRMSDDEGNSWTKSTIINMGPSAYSDIVMLENNEVGILYEGGTESAYEGISFEVIHVTDLN